MTTTTITPVASKALPVATPDDMREFFDSVWDTESKFDEIRQLFVAICAMAGDIECKEAMAIQRLAMIGEDFTVALYEWRHVFGGRIRCFGYGPVPKEGARLREVSASDGGMA
jgi:hypothetical protein